HWHRCQSVRRDIASLARTHTDEALKYRASCGGLIMSTATSAGQFCCEPAGANGTMIRTNTRPRPSVSRSHPAACPWARGRARGQMQKLSAVGKFHFSTSHRVALFDHLVGATQEWQRNC